MAEASSRKAPHRAVKLTSMVVLGLVAMMAIAAYAYKVRYSMAPAEAFEVGERGTRPAVLVATQGSTYKDAVVAGLVQALSARRAYLRVIDVSRLSAIEEIEWDAIVVLHTWESWKPQPDARTFVERAKRSGKLVVLSTSGSGEENMPGVDALSSASELARAPRDAAELTRRVEQVLGSAAP